MNLMQKLLLGITATGIVAADAHAGRWLSRDPIQEGAGFVERDPRPQFDPNLLQQRRGRNEPNLYAFVCNSPVDEIDPLGLFLAASEGYAFRDPWYGSLGWQTGSGFQLSPSAFYDGWASPWLTSICNTGTLGDRNGEPYPKEATSFVKGYLMNSWVCSRICG